MEAIPLYAIELIEQLDKMYPLKNPSVDDNLVIIQRRAGKRELIEHLLTLLKREKEEDIQNR